MKVHAIQTGLVRIKRRQVEPVASGLRRRVDTLRDRQWSDWLPIHAWVIEHPGGPIVVDTGETARVNDPGYLLRWHPYSRQRASSRPRRACAGGSTATWPITGHPGCAWRTLELAPDPTGAFAAAATLADGVRAVATPGHTPGHVSVVVDGNPPILIAGDVTYRLDLLMAGGSTAWRPTTPRPARASPACARSCEATGAVCLPTHDPGSARRLAAATGGA